jgi:hypothetical protein
VTDWGILTQARAEHPLNVKSPIDVTLLGIIIDVNDEHALNIQFPMEVTVSGMFTTTRELQYPKP